jgi:hypothetical protein
VLLYVDEEDEFQRRKGASETDFRGDGRGCNLVVSFWLEWMPKTSMQRGWCGDFNKDNQRRWLAVSKYLGPFVTRISDYHNLGVKDKGNLRRRKRRIREIVHDSRDWEPGITFPSYAHSKGKSTSRMN